MGLLPDQQLLLCPVDMPALRRDDLNQLTAAAAIEPEAIHLAHDGSRLQPLLGVYPSGAAVRQSLTLAIAGGERRLQTWLGQVECRSVSLDARAIRNVNSADELALPPQLG
jgi:molybdopterin-guanine dinucleotide biosynthesis protein A